MLHMVADCFRHGELCCDLHYQRLPIYCLGKPFFAPGWTFSQTDALRAVRTAVMIEGPLLPL